MMRRPIAGGFTLIELLVVIGIIALLVGILLPALQRAREEAMKSACASQMRQWGAAINAYAGDFRDLFPPHEGGRTPGPTHEGYRVPFFRDYLGVAVAGRAVTGEDIDASQEMVTHCPTFDIDRHRGFETRTSSSWASGQERERFRINYFFWPRRTNSSAEMYADWHWFLRGGNHSSAVGRLGSPLRDAPYLQGMWRADGSGSSFEDGPGELHSAPHMSGRDRETPAGFNNGYEDGSVRWTDADEIEVGMIYGSSSHHASVWLIPVSGHAPDASGNGHQ